jgi:hypothetical protein
MMPSVPEDEDSPFSPAEQERAETDISFLLLIMKEGLPIDPDEVDAVIDRHHKFVQLADLHVELIAIDLARRREILPKLDKAIKGFLEAVNVINRSRTEKPNDPEHQGRCDRRQLDESRRFHEALIEMGEHRRLGVELGDPKADGRQL